MDPKSSQSDIKLGPAIVADTLMLLVRGRRSLPLMTAMTMRMLARRWRGRDVRADGDDVATAGNEHDDEK